MVWAEAAQAGFPSDFIMLLLTTFGGFLPIDIIVSIVSASCNLCSAALLITNPRSNIPTFRACAALEITKLEFTY
ncbi:hypothetical protein T01_6253 [Trichinella spiralis]|uniref:Uncharacterized protein n=1 Tax=Trichinella spiralis TaxID=6334 RepID=A0A0V1B6Y5_TRISP|nr:hypothetical protein T01_8724 [Trichinella spiralis]KRY32757.1 hypothetical protein T01_6253 [Trichinella spiralis]